LSPYLSEKEKDHENYKNCAGNSVRSHKYGRSGADQRPVT
jgi:hypothetical protein